MAPPGIQKRKPGSQAYESDDGFVANDSDTLDPPTKRSKTSTSTSKSSNFESAGKPQFDTDGNQYWEISKMRRVTISEFKGKTMVNIREYYEKDGKDLPGKKGISMTMEQYSALVALMPEIDKALEEKGEKVSRPKHVAAPEAASAGGEQEEGNEEVEAESEGVKPKAQNGKRKKANIEATSDEDEED